MADNSAIIDPPACPDLPTSDDWHGWLDILGRADTGTIDCVPECMLPLIAGYVGGDGKLTDPNIVPGTPYGVAKFMLSSRRIPWRGTGLLPESVRDLLARGFSPDIIVQAAAEAAKLTASEKRKLLAEIDEREREADPTPPVVEHADSFADLYMIRSANGPIKIGISVDPKRRMKALQTAHPYRLEIACTIPGGANLEIHYHERFAAHRLAGEWFEPHPDILAEINRLNTHPTRTAERGGRAHG